MKKVLVVMVVLMAVIVPSLSYGQEQPVVYNDPQMTARLDRVGIIVSQGVQKLYPKWQGKLRFRVYDDEDLNAMAESSGNIWVSRGMMSATTDDELAGVLNHEATHVVQGHGRAQAKKGIAWRLGTLLLGKALGVSADTADTGSQILTGIASGGYSRKDEQRADDGSVDLCIAEGVDPYAPARVMKKLQTKYGNGSAKAPVIGWFASHPDTGSRMTRLTERAQKLTSTTPPSYGQVGAVQAAPPKPVFLGGVAVIVRDNAGGGGFGWGGYGNSEEAVKTTLESALQQTGRFTIVDQSGRQEAWDEQDLGDTGRMDPETVPQKGKTHGAKWFAIVTLNYCQVTQQGNVNVGSWNKQADVHLMKAEIRGKVKLEPVEKSVLAWTTDFRGSEIGYEAETSVSSDWSNGIDLNWQSQPAGKAVESACRKVVAALVSHIDGQSPTQQPALPTQKVKASDTMVIASRSDTLVEFQLHIKPLPLESKVKPITTTMNVPYGAVQSADYILLMFKDNTGQNVIVAKINIQKVSATEIWGTIEYPKLSQLDLKKVQFVRLMKSD